MPGNYPKYFKCPYCNSKISSKSVFRLLMSYVASFTSEKKREASRLAKNATIRKTPTQEQLESYGKHQNEKLRYNNSSPDRIETSQRPDDGSS